MSTNTPSPGLLPIPKRTDDDYAQRVLEVGVDPNDAAVITDPTKTDDQKKAVLAKELVTCNELIGTWSDSAEVVNDCKKLLQSANVEISKAKGDLILAYNTLWEVRQRLVQAWRSQQNKGKVLRLFVWLIVALGGCVYLLVWLHLLPGETPRVAASNVNVAALYSSFLFGAIGGIFDALSALSEHYTQETFNSDYWLWYLGCPVLGAILGAVVFAVFLAGLLGTTGRGLPGNTTVNVPQNLWGNLTQSQLGVLVNAASNTDPSTRAALILVLAFLAGFKQITVTKFLERIATSVFGGSNEKKAKS
jgi:hypothetical protein